jgi:hypothetical protein
MDLIFLKLNNKWLDLGMSIIQIFSR